MDVDNAPTTGLTTLEREKTMPFLVRTFVKIGGFHRLSQFEDATFPTTDEHQLFTWKDATLREVLTTLRMTAPHVAEFRHPLAKFLFKIVYADPGNKGRFAQKDIGMVYSRDILGEPGSLNSAAPRLLEDDEPPARGAAEREERTLEDLRFIPGDFLLVSVLLPKNVSVPTELSIKGSAPSAPTNGWRGPGTGASGPGGLSAGRSDRERERDGGWGRGAGPAPGRGGGGHWRGASDPPSGRGRGGGRGEFGRDRDSDSRVPPPRRRDSPPPRGGRGGRGRSRSRSRSPPRRRR
ncbi:Sin3 associated polypeptide p18-domain-containing protein [Crepidotus variabilis]|uniref:Sin3 associated polypeptide p18-domain-containing protein n=1 Tax=Crepidotus variabilis TaxID=179855 RepID=A0A9P6ETT1_9AGAR|nr:Sin3 associated polypeptide p18-domain-containing protein [Crepidotus variabilis]